MKGPASTGPFVRSGPSSSHPAERARERSAQAASGSRYCFQVAGIVGEASWMKM
jgi:hypothetical protein